MNTDVAQLDITDVDKVLGLVREVRPYAIRPAAIPFTGSVEYSVIVRRKQMHNRFSQFIRTGRRPDLVHHYPDLIMGFRQTKHRSHKVLTLSIQPRRPYYKIILGKIPRQSGFRTQTGLFGIGELYAEADCGLSFCGLA